MQKSKDDKAQGCCVSHRCEILGVIFLIVATVLTLLTFSGIGIFGMYLVGLAFCCHRHLGRRCCSGCECGCCSKSSMSCDMPAPKKETAGKKTTSKK